MHMPNCVCCGQTNLYYQADPRIAEGVSNEVVGEILQFYGLETDKGSLNNPIPDNITAG